MEEYTLDYSEILNLIVDNVKKIVFPEEWLDIDLSMSKQEIFAMLLVDRYGEIIMSQVASYVNIPMSTATGIVDRLVKNGYLQRERSESDRRIVVIRLTQKGKELIDGLKNKGNEYIKVIREGLTQEEQEFLFKIIMKIFDSLNEKPQVETKEDVAGKIRKINIE